MMLDRGETSETKKNGKTERAKMTGEHDPLRNTTRAESTTTYNRYSLLTIDDDCDNEDIDSHNTNEQHDSPIHYPIHYTTLH